MFDRGGPVLGIDPGLSTCGYGVVQRQDRRLSALACGVIRSDPATPLPERLAALEADLDAFVREIHPCALAVERVLFQANVRTAISVGQASGLALAVAARAGVPVTHYSPNEVKLAIAANGAAGKSQVQAMVTRVLHLSEQPPPDAADALALAVCHLWRMPLRASVARAVAATGERGS
ncbi:MAG TPA: crossover junction endodeoxyribonuclease RuvC [Acidimicrobiia bacterium]|nr:crossover junction endodeoxyribonuclease RuvC [Acidimicrobiia bacterium]